MKRFSFFALATMIAGSAGAVAQGGVRTGAAAFGDWSTDEPGVTRLIRPADLPQPGVTGSPPGRSQTGAHQLRVPAGFAASAFSPKLDGVRVVRVAPNGDVFAARTRPGIVQVLRPSADRAKVDRVETFASGLQGPFGIAFYPPGPNPQWVYVAETTRVLRYAYKPGDLTASAKPEVVVSGLAGGGHTTRDIAVSPDGRTLYVSVGSQSNVAESMGRQPDLASFERTHGLGATWGSEEWRAAVLAFDADGKNRRPFANGIRNCVGLNQNPATGDIYCSTNERDTLGNNLVPDYLTRVKENNFYGWPWYYLGDNEEPRLAGARPDLKGKVTVPDVLFQSHSAALQTTFYPTQITGASAFPAEYRGDAFVALHGSWNRAPRTGYKVVRVKLNNGVPVGEYQDFLTGFVIDQEKVWGRPVGVTVMKDGSLLVSEDGNSTIWRVAFTVK